MNRPVMVVRVAIGAAIGCAVSLHSELSWTTRFVGAVAMSCTGAWSMMRHKERAWMCWAACAFGMGLGMVFSSPVLHRDAGLPLSDIGVDVWRMEVRRELSPSGPWRRAIVRRNDGKAVLCLSRVPMLPGWTYLAATQPLLPGLPSHPHDFDEARWLRGLGVDGKCSAEWCLPLGTAPGWGAALQRWAHGLDGRIRSRCALFDHPAGSGLMLALLTGEKSALPMKVRRALSNLGLAHLTAVSGFHTGLLAAGLLWLSSLLGMGRRWRAVLVVSGVWAYVVVCGCPGSAVRAAGMISMAALLSALHRRMDAATALAVMGLVLLAFRPHMVLNLGVQLSFAATAGILWLHECLRSQGFKGWHMKAGMALGVPLVAVAFTAPLAWPAFGTLSPVFLPANLLATPCVTGIAGLAVLWQALPVEWLPFVEPPIVRALSFFVDGVVSLAGAAPPLLLPLDARAVFWAGGAVASGTAAGLSFRCPVRWLMGGVLLCAAILRWQAMVEAHPRTVRVDDDLVCVANGEVTLFTDTPSKQGLKWKTRSYAERVSMQPPRVAVWCGSRLAFSRYHIRHKALDGTWAEISLFPLRSESPVPHMLPRNPSP